MRNRDTVRVRIAGAWTHIDPGVLTLALARQEGAMDQDKVRAWSDEAGLLLCRDCADDAKAGGARLTQTRVIKGRLCACGQEIGKQ